MEFTRVFRNRREAGRALANRLRGYAGRADVVVLALPRGGVPVAYEIARTLGAPLDVFLVRKLGVPGKEELALGAIASGGVRFLNEEVIHTLGIPPEDIEAVTARERCELARREEVYRGGRPLPDPRDKVVLLVDDGLATGSTMRAAIAAVRQSQPARLVVAVPVAARAVYEEFAEEVDEIVCSLTPEVFHAVGLWYEDFSPTTDEEVLDLLAQAAAEPLPVSPEAVSDPATKPLPLTDRDRTIAEQQHPPNEGPENPEQTVTQVPAAPPAEEWGARHETGKAIARGGKTRGRVHGAAAPRAKRPKQ